VRVISTEFGRENYTFDIAQAVRRSSSEDADTAATAPASLDGLKLLGPVKYLQTKPTKAATVSYTGYVMGLENVHNALRAWALTQGYEVTDRPYELYKNGIDQAFTEDGQYDVFWTIK
jgi:effector-binding domain-containing protein